MGKGWMKVSSGKRAFSNFNKKVGKHSASRLFLYSADYPKIYESMWIASLLFRSSNRSIASLPKNK